MDVSKIERYHLGGFENTYLEDILQFSTRKFSKSLLFREIKKMAAVEVDASFHSVSVPISIPSSSSSSEKMMDASPEEQIEMEEEPDMEIHTGIYRVTMTDPEGDQLMRRCIVLGNTPGEALQQTHEKLKGTEGEWDFCFAAEEWFSAPANDTLTDEEDGKLTDKAYSILERSRKLTNEDWEILAQVIQTRDFRDSHRVVIEKLVEPIHPVNRETEEEIAGMMTSSLNLKDTGSKEVIVQEKEKEHETDDEDYDVDSVC
jgi:hypothetical protein